MYIEVLTQIGAKAVDQNYTYHVPDSLKDKIKIGIRVKIPFGKMTLEGFVMNINSNITYDKSKIKDIIEVSDEEPVLNEKDISQIFANINPAIHPRNKLGAKTPPHPPPPFVAVEAKTLNMRTSPR